MNRRAFLAASSAVPPALVAGCLGRSDASDDEPSLEPVTKWSIPSADDAVPSHGYKLYASSPARTLRAAEAAQSNASAVRRTLEYVWGEVDRAAVDQHVEVRTPEAMEFPYYWVFSGSFDADVARDRLSELSERHAGTYEGFDLYANVTRDGSGDGLTFACGVGDGAVLQVGGWVGEFGTLEQVERVVDVATGATDPFPETAPAVADAVDGLEPAATSYFKRLDPEREQSFAAGRLAGAAAVAGTLEYEGDTRRGRERHVFESAADADTDVLDEYVSWKEDREQVSTATYDVDGRVASVEVEGAVDRSGR